MAWAADGSGITDGLDTNYNGTSTQKSCSFMIYLDGDQGASDCYLSAYSGSFTTTTWHGFFAGTGNREIRLQIGTNGTAGHWSSSTLTADQWYSVVITHDRTNAPASHEDPNIYIDGTLSRSEVTAPTGSWTTSNANDYMLMNRADGVDRCMAGAMCELAFWNRILSAAEAAALGNRFSPLFFPNGLQYYLPAVSLTGEADRIGGIVGTHTNTTFRAHPPMIYPASVIPFHVAAAAAAAQFPGSGRIGGRLSDRWGRRVA